MTAFEIRKNRHFDEFKWLYCELYEGGEPAFCSLLARTEAALADRPEALCMADLKASLDPAYFKRHDFDAERLVIEAFPLCGDFECRETFDRTAEQLLDTVNHGAQGIYLKGIDELFTIPGSGSRNLRKTHNLLRMLRIFTEMAAPSVLLLADPAKAPDRRTALFGTVEKPELHLLFDDRFSPTLWQTIATKDTRLLANEVNAGAGNRQNTMFRRVSYELPVEWQLDFDYLNVLQMEKRAHCLFLDDFFTKTFDRAEYIPQIFGLFHAFLLSESGIVLSDKTVLADEALCLALKKQTAFRKSDPVFDSDADVWTPGTGNNSVIGIGRYKNGRKFYGLYNFSDTEQLFELHDPGIYHNIMKDTKAEVVNLIRLKAYGYAWLMAE